MRQCSSFVLDVSSIEAEIRDSVVRQGDEVVALGGVTHQQTLPLLQVFERPDDVGVRVGGRAVKEVFGQDTRLLLFLEEVDYVFFDLC